MIREALNRVERVPEEGFSSAKAREESIEHVRPWIHRGTGQLLALIRLRMAVLAGGDFELGVVCGTQGVVKFQGLGSRLATKETSSIWRKTPSSRRVSCSSPCGISIHLQALST